MRKWFGFLSLILALSLVPAGFATTDAEAAKFRIGMHRQTFGSFTAVAMGMGYFDEEFGKGNWEVKVFAQGKLVIEALLSRSLDVGHGATRPYVDGVAKKAGLVMVSASSSWCKSMSIWVPIDSPIKTMADLKGKTIAEKKGTSTHFVFDNGILPAFGMKPGDIKIMNTTTAERLSAFRAKVVSAMVIGAPTSFRLIDMKWGRPIVDYCKYDNPPAMIFIELANPRTLKSNPGGVVKYLRAYLKSAQLWKKDPDKFAKVYHKWLIAKGRKVDYSIARRSINVVRPLYNITPRIINALNATAKVQKGRGKIRRLPDFAGGEGIERGPLTKALASMKMN